MKLVNFKKIAVAINVLLCPYYTHATDYTTPISGPITFENGDTVNISNGNSSISDLTSGGTGIQVNNNGAISINTTGSITSAVQLSNGAANNLGSGSTIVTNGNGYASGIEIKGSGTSLTATDLNITAISKSADSAYGLDIENGARVHLKGSSSITATGTGVMIYASPNDKASFTADQVSINATGTNSTGIHTEQNTEVNLGDGSLIKVTGSNATGIENYQGTLTADNLTIIQDSSAGTKGYAIDVRGNMSINGGTITANGGYGVSVFQGGLFNYKNGSITSTANGTFALQVQSTTSKANLDNVELNSNGNGYTLWVIGGEVNANNLSINASNTAYGLVAQNQGKVVFKGNTTINSGNSEIAMVVDGNNSQVTTDTDGSKMTIDGGLFAQNQGLIDLNLLQGSYLKSVVSTSDNSTTKLSMTGTTWDMTDSSVVTNLTANDSSINFLSTPNNYQTLEVANLAGNNANFGMHVNLGGITTATRINNQGERIGTAGVDGDLLTVTDTLSNTGNYKLAITNNGSAATQGNEVLQVVETPENNSGNFSLVKPVEAGAYEYSLRQSINNSNNSTGWELYSTGRKTTTAEAATSFLNVAYLTSYIENQTLLQRLGDLRNSEVAGVKSDGLWIKGFGGKLSAFSGNSMKGFDMTYTGTQLGIDKNIDMQSGRLLIGIMAGFTRTNPNYRDGNGTGKNYTTGLYATYLNDNGIYVDNVLKYNSMHNQFNVRDTAGNNVKGTGKTQGIMLSTEIGKRFWLEGKQQGFYLEPQAQLSYGYQNGDTVHASNGLKVGLSHYNSALGRVSGIAGYQIQGENPINIYVKTGVVREMSGSASYRFNNGDKKGHTFRSSWFDNGIGANVTINKKHNIYTEVDYSTGGKFDSTMFNLGYRYSF
ncbi:hypothetical protein DKL61_14765 [Gammaproteobacteria bacterium ESL0073]|nr:hypothetical protein DKL61_14765 [Gammaproteobacteria bacterium ESL0073]